MKKYILLGSLVFLIFSCAKDIPTNVDGTLSLEVFVFCEDTTALSKIGEAKLAPVAGAKVLLTSTSYYEDKDNLKTYESYTDISGRIRLNNMAVSTYNLFVEKKEISNTNTTILRGSKVIDLVESNQDPDTVIVSKSTTSNLVINEIYYCGPVNNAYYFFDQFVELYNTSDQTIYLDGMFLCRASQSINPDIEINDFVQVINLFQFPGEPLTGASYPIEPGQFIAVAQDAIDHSQFIPNAVNLADSDWEFYNPYGAEIDNPAPNVTNIIPEKTTDFMINLVHNGVILADGSDWYWGDVSPTGYQYIHIPLINVIDAVEYSTNPEKTKEITLRLDAGFAGVGVAKYSGKSVQRIEPGYDSNNSTIDFVNLDKPTPGYQE